MSGFLCLVVPVKVSLTGGVRERPEEVSSPEQALTEMPVRGSDSL